MLTTEERLFVLSIRREPREKLALEANQNPGLLRELWLLALQPLHPVHHKAWWVLELVLENDMQSLWLQRDALHKKLRLYKHPSSLRPLAKIGWQLLQHYRPFLQTKEKKRWTEAAWQWLCTPHAVATQVYAMNLLYEAGAEQKGSKEELIALLQTHYPEQKPAYKAAARKLFKRWTVENAAEKVVN